MRAGLAFGMAAVMSAWAGLSEAADPKKSGYTLFNPTPDSMLRDIDIDRPGPLTLDAGRAQIETYVLDHSRSHKDGAGVWTDSYALTTNIRLGLTSTSEINVAWQPYGHVRTHDPANPTTSESGIGGVDLGFKVNLWGNDTLGPAGTSALGVVPFVAIPTDRANGISPAKTEGGIRVPFAVKLSEAVQLDLGGGVAAVTNDDGLGRHTEWMPYASVQYAWSDTISTYYDVTARLNTDRGDAVSLGTGLTYKVNAHLQIDVGVYFGVTDAADRINPFLGIARRF